MNSDVLENNSGATRPHSMAGVKAGLRIIIAGGGTGGHIFPAIAIANALKKIEPGIEILFVGAKGKMEMEKVPQAGYTIKGIDIAGFDRSSLIKNIGLPFKLLKSFFQVRRIIKEFKPIAAIGVGGYSSFPVLRFAQAKGITTFIHESNSFAGKSNILLGKKARAIFTATGNMTNFFPNEKIIVTGNPVRQSIVRSRISREAGILFFNLDPAKKTVLVTGGSLGARGINETIDKDLDQFEKNNIQLIWQTGKPYALKAMDRCAGKKYIWTGEFITQMEYAFAAADCAISRSGAMAIAELCVAGKPVVFVPFPFAAEDHQTVNAKTLVDLGAGLMVTDEAAKDKLVATVIGLVTNEEQKERLRKNISKLAVSNADEVIAGNVLTLIGRKMIN